MDEIDKGVTPESGDALQEDHAASETEESQAPQPSQDTPDAPVEGEEGEQGEAGEEETDRGTKAAKEPESRYYQQLKNENADMRALLSDPKALKHYLQESEGTQAPKDGQKDDLKQLVDEATTETGQVDAYKLAQLMEQRMLTKVDQGMKYLAQNMGKAQQMHRSYDNDKMAVRSEHPELDPKSKEYDPELDAFVGERFIAQGGMQGKISLKQVADQTFAYLTKVRGSATKQAETEVVRKRVGAIPQQKVSGKSSDSEADMSPEQIIASRVLKQIQRRS